MLSRAREAFKPHRAALRAGLGERGEREERGEEFGERIERRRRDSARAREREEVAAREEAVGERGGAAVRNAVAGEPDRLARGATPRDLRALARAASSATGVEVRKLGDEPALRREEEVVRVHREPVETGARKEGPNVEVEPIGKDHEIPAERVGPLDDRRERGVEREAVAELEDLVTARAREIALLLEALAAAERPRVPPANEPIPRVAVRREALEERVPDVARRNRPVEIEEERGRTNRYFTIPGT